MKFFSKWRVLLQCSSAGMIQPTRKARRVVFWACEEAMRDGSNLVTPEHLLLGLLRGDDALAARFGLAGIDSVGQQVTNISGAMPTASYLTLSEAARQVMSCAREERQNLSHKHTGTEHLLLGISRSASSAAAALEQRGWSADRIRRLITSQSLTGGWQTG